MLTSFRTDATAVIARRNNACSAVGVNDPRGVHEVAVVYLQILNLICRLSHGDDCNGIVSSWPSTRLIALPQQPYQPCDALRPRVTRQSPVACVYAAGNRTGHGDTVGHFAVADVTVRRQRG